MHNKLLELLDTKGIHRETESFSTDPRSALQRIKVRRRLNLHLDAGSKPCVVYS